MFKALLVVVSMLMIAGINTANATPPEQQYELDMEVCVIGSSAGALANHCFKFTSDHLSSDSCEAKKKAVLDSDLKTYVPDGNQDGRADMNKVADQHWSDATDGSGTGSVNKAVIGGCFKKDKIPLSLF